MRQLNKTEEFKTIKVETLEMSYENQDEFDFHSEELHQQGWDRNIYSQIFNFDTGQHEYVFYSRETELSLEEIMINSSKARKEIYEQEEKSINNAIKHYKV